MGIIEKVKRIINHVLILQTTDVQTASLVIVNCVPHIPSEVSKDARVLSWIEK